MSRRWRALVSLKIPFALGGGEVACDSPASNGKQLTNIHSINHDRPITSDDGQTPTIAAISHGSTNRHGLPSSGRRRTIAVEAPVQIIGVELLRFCDSPRHP